MALEELQRSPEKADRGRGLLVAQDLGVGQAGGVVDGDVDVVPADDLAIDNRFNVSSSPATASLNLTTPLSYGEVILTKPNQQNRPEMMPFFNVT